jgi:hypothetical protein
MCGNFFSRDNGNDTRKFLRFRCVDPPDARMRMNAACHGHVQHAGQHNVIDVGRCARYKPRIFFSLHSLTDITLRHDDLLISGSDFGLAFYLRGCRFHGIHNVLIARAPAQVSSQGFTDFFFGWRSIAGQKLMRAHDHSRRAVSALQSVLFPEALLQWMEFAVFGHALDSHEVRTVGLNRKHRARLYSQTIRKDRAGAADTRLAADVRSRESRDIADKMREQKPRLNVFLIQPSINCDFHVHT